MIQLSFSVKKYIVVYLHVLRIHCNFCLFPQLIKTLIFISVLIKIVFLDLGGPDCHYYIISVLWRYVGALLIHTDSVYEPTSSWWLQMPWCQIGTRPSATTMMTSLRLEWQIKNISQYIYFLPFHTRLAHTHASITFQWHWNDLIPAIKT